MSNDQMLISNIDWKITKTDKQEYAYLFKETYKWLNR